jgi:hypothetical protein
MLGLFALSITPKQWLHDIITGHKHSYSKLEKTSNIQASKNGFQCSWNNQEVESPFTTHTLQGLDEVVLHHVSHSSNYTRTYFSTDALFSSLRGPPSVIS